MPSRLQDARHPARLHAPGTRRQADPAAGRRRVGCAAGGAHCMGMGCMHVRPVMHGRSRSACASACCHVHAGARLAICFFAWRSMLRRAARAVLEVPPGPNSPGSWRRHSAGKSHCAAQAPTAGCEIRAIKSPILQRPATPRWAKRQVLLDDFAPVLTITPVRGTESTCGLHHVLVE